MEKFYKACIDLRTEIIDYIRKFIEKKNRSIIVEKGNITYMKWDCAFKDKEFAQCVPEMEISMITLTPQKDVRFIDTAGDIVYPSNFDTEELLWIVDYLEALEEEDIDTQ